MQIGLVGAGRVGSAIARALHNHGYNLAGVASRSPASAATLAEELSVPSLELAALVACSELLVLAVSDDAIAPLAQQLAQLSDPQTPRSVVHCSGALALEPLQALAVQGWLTGAWHPLQSFPTRNTSVAPGITWGLTAVDPLLSILQEWTQALGGQARYVPAEAKTRYHAAAALACNYAITLAAQAVELLQTCGFTDLEALEALVPLLKGNLQMLEHVGLPGALTGPLARGDIGTVTRHLADLEQTNPEIAALYRACGHATLPLLRARSLPDETITALEHLLSS